jgi:hypothetical protein
MTTETEAQSAGDVTQEAWADVNTAHLIALLRREGKYSGVWFSEKLTRAACLLDDARHRIVATQRATSASEARIAELEAEKASLLFHNSVYLSTIKILEEERATLGEHDGRG